MKKCKITVLRREFYPDLAAEYYSDFPNFGKCPLFSEGQSYITGGPFGTSKPDDFCDNAWQAIALQATSIASGGKVFGLQDYHVACCNDGSRPVIFRLEPYEDDEEPHK